MKRLKFIASTIFLFIAVSFTARAQININGEFRTRGIVNNGYSVPVLKNSNPNFSIDQRTRLNIAYISEKYTVYISLQDARIWGSDDLLSKAGTWGNTYSFGVHESWVQMNLYNNSYLKIGRQEWNYDNIRLLSYRNWITPGLSYDGLLFHSGDIKKNISLDIGLSYNNNGNSMGKVDNFDWQVEKLKSMNFIHLKKAFTDKTNLALIFSLSAKTDTSNNVVLGTGTHGLVLNHNKGKSGVDGVFGSLEGYYQHGVDLVRGSDTNYKNISAYMLAADIGLRTLSKKFEISLGAELLSGHDYSNTNTDYSNTRHSFDLLYGGRFPFYGGNMNHFVVQDSYLAGTKGGGYFDPYIKVKYLVNKKNSIEVAFFNPILTTNVRAYTEISNTTKKPTGLETDENGNPVYWKGNLGQYIDLTFTHKFSKEVILKAGTSYGIVSDIKNQMVYGYEDVASKQLFKTGQNYFAWIMFIVKPKLFTNK